MGKYEPAGMLPVKDQEATTEPSSSRSTAKSVAIWARPEFRKAKLTKVVSPAASHWAVRPPRVMAAVMDESQPLGTKGERSGESPRRLV